MIRLFSTLLKVTKNMFEPPPKKPNSLIDSLLLFSGLPKLLLKSTPKKLQFITKLFPAHFSGLPTMLLKFGPKKLNVFLDSLLHFSRLPKTLFEHPEYTD